MKLVVDASAFAKRYVLEDGSESMHHLLAKASQLGLCIILPPEIISGLNRRLREGTLSKKDYRTIKKQLADDVHNAMVLQLTPSVIASATTLLETNALRAMDALHIACAAQWRADLFATSDKRQMKAAVNAGLLTEFIGETNDTGKENPKNGR